MIYLAAIPLLIGLTLALFIASQRISDELHWTGRWLLFPWLCVGLAADVVLNAVIASVVFVELPHEWTLSARIKRIEHGNAGWRRSIATWVCKNFLKPIDEDHC